MTLWKRRNEHGNRSDTPEKRERGELTRQTLFPTTVPYFLLASSDLCSIPKLRRYRIARSKSAKSDWSYSNHCAGRIL